jgi:hypothetical protein
MAGAADEGCEQHVAGLRGAEQRRIGKLEVDRGEATGDAGEQAGQAEGKIAHHLRIVAHELRPFGVVAHGIAHAAKGRARQRIHQRDAYEAPGGNQVIDLNLRTKVPVKQAQQLGAIGSDALPHRQKRAQDQRARADQLGEPQRDHGKGRTGALGRYPAK